MHNCNFFRINVKTIFRCFEAVDYEQISRYLSSRARSHMESCLEINLIVWKLFNVDRRVEWQRISVCKTPLHSFSNKRNTRKTIRATGTRLDSCSLRPWSLNEHCPCRSVSWDAVRPPALYFPPTTPTNLWTRSLLINLKDWRVLSFRNNPTRRWI